MLNTDTPIMKGVAGLCVVRDAIDIVSFLCGHYLHAGFAHLAFIDDGSTDGTFEYLSKVARRTGRLSVRQVRREMFEQQALINEAANSLIADGFRIIVPFDADEFWIATARDFEQLSASDSEIVFQGRWVNFVQDRICHVPARATLLRMIYRAPRYGKADPESTIRYAASFVCHAEIKVAFRSTRNVELDLGQHNILQGPLRARRPLMEIFHLPLRSKREIGKRALNYEPRRAPLRTAAGVSWQSAFHHKAVMVGRTDEVWAANSFDAQGRLDVYGSPLTLVRDTRLRHTLLKAAWYLFRRYRLLPG